MFKKLLAIFAIVTGVGYATAQQPQTSDLPPLTPLYSVDAKTANGVAPGYKPTNSTGTGLVLNISPGTANCSGIVTYAGGTLTMSNNTTNYVYLDTTASCAPTVSTTPFTSTQIPVAKVVTSGGNITQITDDRTFFFTSSSSGTGGTDFQFQYQQQGTGQYVLVPFTVNACSTGSGSAGAVNGVPGNPPPTLGNGFYSLQSGASASCTFSTPVLTGITTGQITAIYAVGWKSQVISGDGGGAEESTHLAFSGTGFGGCSPLRNGSSGGTGSTPLQYGCQLTGALANIGTITAFADANSAPFHSGSTSWGYVAALEVDYTGSPVTPSGIVVSLGPGLSWDPSDSTISLFDYAIFPMSVSAAQPFATSDPAGTYVLVQDGANSTDCTVGGGSNPVWCVVNTSGGFTGVAFSGTGNAITALTGDGTATGPGSASFILATVNGSPGACGDATHICKPTTNGKGLVTSQTTVGTVAQISGGLNGTQTTSSQLLGTVPVTTTFTVASSCPNSKGYAGIGATSTSAFTVVDVTTSTTLCTATFASGGSGGPATPTWSGSGGTITAGDVVAFFGASAADSTLANVGLSVYVTH
jgi:hypothetical protein